MTWSSEEPVFSATQLGEAPTENNPKPESRRVGLDSNTYTLILDYVAQVTIYLPDSLAADLKRRAKKAKKSLSAYIAELARGSDDSSGWPDGFAQLYGSWQGEFPELDPLPLDDPKLE